jgi:integrase/recombinase XerD
MKTNGKLRNLLEEFLEHRKALKASVHTIAGLRSAGGLFLDFLEKSLEVKAADRLYKKHIGIYQKYMSEYITAKGYPLKASSINSRVKSTRAFLDWLFENDFITRRLSRDLQYVKISRFLPGSVLTHREVRKLIRQIDTSGPAGIRDRAVVEILYSTGVRIGELCSLEIRNVDLENSMMKVFGKGRRERMVPIGKTAVRWLKNYILGIRPFQQRTAKHTQTVFLNSRGKPLQQRSVREAIHRYSRKAAIETNVTPHTFRRSCTTEMLKNNANIYHVKELLGHKTLDTLRHYAKLNIADLKKTHTKYHPREKDRF